MSDYRAKLAFEILARENSRMLTAYLRTLVDDESVVDDLFQESMLVAWRRLDPALAYYGQLEAKLKLHHLPPWQLFRDYQACSPDASDDEVRRFSQTKAIPQCGLCPSYRTKFVHPNPLQRSALR